ncbi:PH domain-containing protein [Streptomyces violaceorubidus]
METGSPDDTGTAGATRAAGRADPANPAGPAVPVREEPVWTGLPPGLLHMRRLLLVVWLGADARRGVLPALFLAPSGPPWRSCRWP